MKSDKQPLISIIIPCFNCGSFIAETLDSVIHQTYSNWECIIVDNGSTDNSTEIAESYTKKDPRIKLVFETKKGVSAARNKGISSSSGRYILPLDADDKIGSSYLEKAGSYLETHNNVKVVYCNAELFMNSSGTWKLPDFSMKQLLIENLIFCTAMFRRSDFECTKGYNEDFVTGFEDWDFWLSFIAKDEEVYKLPDVLFYYRIRDKSRNNSLDEVKQRLLRKQIYENHKELYDKYFKLSDVIFDYHLEKIKSDAIIKSRSYVLFRKVISPIFNFGNKFRKG